MEEEVYEEGGGRSLKVAIVVLILVLLVAAAGFIYFSFFREQPEEEPKGVGYAMDAGVVLTQEELDAAMANAAANDAGMVALSYKNGAYSSDGENFECYVVNSASNQYDMFLAMYTDVQLTDQVFLSGLLKPGSGYDKLKLSHKLEKGTHTIYVMVTQVDRDEEGNEVIVNQVSHTMDFHVV